MAATLFSTGCPKCNVLKQKLDEKGIAYEINSDVDKIIELGFMAAPVLQIGDTYMEFSDAIKWLRENNDTFIDSCESCNLKG